MRRFLPLLLFALLALASCGETAPGSDAEELGTISGTVLLGPMCPVQTEASPCPDEPLAGTKVRVLTAEGHELASALSDENGGFAIEVEAGTFTLEAVVADDPARSAQAVPVTVVAGRTVEVTVPVDSGIR
jgi:hypothetical protein